MGRDSLCPINSALSRLFQSTLPAWGETSAISDKRKSFIYFNPLSPHGERLFQPITRPCCHPFQSTLPAWGETRPLLALPHGVFISIHSPRMGRDPNDPNYKPFTEISIHSPRMGRDKPRQRPRYNNANFNPLSPHGERRYCS